MSQPLPEEPMILVRVRDLIEGLDKKVTAGFDEIRKKLDDRVTLGVFSALRADLDAALRRIDALEDADDKKTAHAQGVEMVVGWVLRFGGWIVATGLGVAWLWITVSHG